MNNASVILNYLRSNKDRLYQEYKLVKIGIFGSVARNEHTEISDIDVIVEFQDGTPELYEKKQKLKNDLQKEFNSQVDICREKYIKPVFKEKIISEAIYV